MILPAVVFGVRNEPKRAGRFEQAAAQAEKPAGGFVDQSGVTAGRRVETCQPNQQMNSAMSGEAGKTAGGWAASEGANVRSRTHRRSTMNGPNQRKPAGGQVAKGQNFTTGPSLPAGTLIVTGGWERVCPAMPCQA